MFATLTRSQTITSGSIGQTKFSTSAVWIIRIEDNLSAKTGELERISDQCRMSEFSQVERASLDCLWKDPDCDAGLINHFFNREPQFPFFIDNPEQMKDLREQVTEKKVAACAR